HRALALNAAEASTEQPDSGNSTPNGSSEEPVRNPEEAGAQQSAQPSAPHSLRPSFAADPYITRIEATPAAAMMGWTEVPGYEIQGILGEGGMGVVYQAKHLPFQRVVALKM